MSALSGGYGLAHLASRISLHTVWVVGVGGGTLAVFWAAAASAGVLGVEFAYRAGASLPVWAALLPVQIGISYALWRLFQMPGQTWLSALVLFSAINTVGRIGLASFVLHEPLTKANAVAAAALIIAVIAKIGWR